MSQSKYSIIANKIKQAFKEQDQSLLYEALAEMHTQFMTYHRLIEIGNRTTCALVDRYLEILDVDSSSSKLTINPVDGRCTLKVSQKVTEEVKLQYIKLARLLMSNELPPITLRGKIKYHNSGYECSLSSGGGKNTHKVRIEENFNE